MHYKYPRVISVRESARIQSFPDSFMWPVGTSPLQQYQQVGNAVFPLLASALGMHLAEAAGFNLDPERSRECRSRARTSCVPARSERFLDTTTAVWL